MSRLRKTFVDELKDLYDAEKQIVKALPKLIKAAEHSDFQASLQAHLSDTEAQIIRLERVFEIFGETVQAKKCRAIQGLIAEGQDVIDDEKGDAALIAAVQKVEHYEIASYGALIAWARLLREEDAVSLLEETLFEEREADERLTEIAESTINPEAVRQSRQTTIKVKRIK